MNQYKQSATIFKAVCDEKRLHIIELLQHGELCACKLTEQTGVPQSALSYHMKILVDSGFVTSRQEGKWTHYRLSTEGCERAVTLLKDLTRLHNTVIRCK